MSNALHYATPSGTGCMGRGASGRYRHAGQKIAGTVNNDGEENDPVKPYWNYWNYVISKLGRVTIEKAGAYQLSLKPDSIVSEQKLGLTLVEVKLVPVQK